MVVSCLGSLVQVCCGEGGTLQSDMTGMCGECSQCMDHTGFAPAQGVCAFPAYTAQAPACSAGELSKVGLCLVLFPGPSRSGSGSRALHKGTDSAGPCVSCTSQAQAAQAQVQALRLSTNAQTRLVLFPGLSSSGNQLLGEHTVPGGLLSGNV